MTDRPETVEEETTSAAAATDGEAGQQAGQPSAAAAGEAAGSAANSAGAPSEGAANGAAEPVAGAPYEAPDEMAARIKELTADLQRLQAEYVNYKRRVDRDRELVVQNARFSVLSALLPVLDDIDRAREHEELTGGFKAVAESLVAVVTGQGLVRYGATGDPFDPRIHEALMHGHSPEVTTTVCDKIVQAGYTIGDRVVRPAKVTVLDPEPGQVDGGGQQAGEEQG